MITDGIHLGLSNEDYHADPALGSTGLKTLARFPPDWRWSRPDNPLYQPPEPKGPIGAGRTLGNALHAYVLEGEAVFNERYRVPKEPPEGLLRSVEAIKEWLDAEGHARPPGPASKLKAGDWQDYARRLGAPLWDDWKAEQEKDPRKAIVTNWLPVIQLIDRQVKAHPDLAELFLHGLPEVSLFWTEKDGLRRKVRFDLIAPGVILDLKSFSGWKKQDQRWALVNEVLTYGYHVSAACYLSGARRLRRFANAGCVHFHPRGGRWADYHDVLDRLARIAEQPIRSWIWLFTKTLECPAIYPLIVPDVTQDEAIKAGRQVCEVALANYRDWSARYGDELWLEPITIIAADNNGAFWPDRLLWEREPMPPQEWSREEEGDDEQAEVEQADHEEDPVPAGA